MIPVICVWSAISVVAEGALWIAGNQQPLVTTNRGRRAQSAAGTFSYEFVTLFGSGDFK